MADTIELHRRNVVELDDVDSAVDALETAGDLRTPSILDIRQHHANDRVLQVVLSRLSSRAYFNSMAVVRSGLARGARR